MRISSTLSLRKGVARWYKFRSTRLPLALPIYESVAAERLALVVRLFLITLLLALRLHGQATLRLRYGGPESSYRIAGISRTTPAVITVRKFLDEPHAKPTHSLANGDTIFIHDTKGCSTVNGYRKVMTANQSAGTFAVTDMANAHVTCESPWETSVGGTPVSVPGFLGKVRNYTTNTISPRVYFSQTGADRIRNEDPDGAPNGPCTAGNNSTVPSPYGPGCAVAPVKVENGVAWQGMVARTDAMVSKGNTCDGTDIVLCATEEISMTTGEDAPVKHAAQIWFADQSQTRYLNAAKYWLNNAERSNIFIRDQAGVIPNFPLNAYGDDWGGTGDVQDYSATAMSEIALGYDIIRSQLTPGQRTAFAQKMLNDQRDRCTNSLNMEAPSLGNAIIRAGSTTITGTGFSTYVPGDFINIQTSFMRDGARLARIVSVTGDSAAEVVWSRTAVAPTSFPSSPHWRIGKVWSNSYCGATFFVAGQTGGFNSANIKASYFVPPTTITASDKVLPIDAAAYANIRHIELPFYIFYDKEAMKVAAMTPTRLTIVRGLFNTTPALVGPYKTLAISRMRVPDFSFNTVGVMGDYKTNHAFSTNSGIMTMLQVLVGDDARAASRYETLQAYYYDIMYPHVSRLQTGNTLGGVGAPYYFYQRYNQYEMPPMLGGRNLTTVSNDWGAHIWAVTTAPYMITSPGGDESADAGKVPFQAQQVGVVLAAATMLNPGLDAERSNHWLHESTRDPNYMGYNIATFSNKYKGIYAGWNAAFNPDTSPKTDYKLGNLWNFFNNPVTRTNGNALLTSKSGWTANDSVVMSWIPTWPDDHQMDNGSAYPGAFLLAKGAHVLMGGGHENGSGVHGTIVENANILSIGATDQMRQTSRPHWASELDSTTTPLRTPMLRNAVGTAEYVYGLVDGKNAYRSGIYTNAAGTTFADPGVLHSLRHELHWKPKAGSPEYWITYDDHATSTSQVYISRQNYLKKNDPAATLTQISASNYSEVLYRHPSKVNGGTASVRTRILYPDGATPNGSVAVSGYQSDVHKVTYTWPRSKSAEEFAIHRISEDTTEVLPAMRLLKTLDANFRGFEIDNTNHSRVVVIGKAGKQYAGANFTTTFPGSGKVLVAGLAPGAYSITRNGTVLLAQRAVGTDGTLLFEATGGPSIVWSITQ